MKEFNFYLCHPRTKRKEVRKWELGFENRTGINLINPFFDTDKADTEMNELGKEKYDLIDDPAIIVEPDLKIIAEPYMRGIIALIDTHDSWGTPMEMRYTKAELKKEVYSVITNGDHNHVWLRYHSDEIFLNTQALEKFLVKKKKNSELIEKVFSREPKTIKSKEECYALYESGLFGNKPFIWDSYEEILSSKWQDKVSIRSKKGVVRKKTKYNVSVGKIPEEIEKLKEIGMKEDDITFNQSMPDNRLLIQGEMMKWHKGIYLTYSTLKTQMNIALKEQPQNAKGLTAKLLLKQNLSPSSYEDVVALMEMFPKDVIEFSAYEIFVGNIPGRNTIIWEVRNY